MPSGCLVLRVSHQQFGGLIPLCPSETPPPPLAYHCLCSNPEGRRREAGFSLSPQSLHGVSWDCFVPATLPARWFQLAFHPSFSCLCTWIVALALACRYQITLGLPMSFCVSYFTIRARNMGFSLVSHTLGNLHTVAGYPGHTSWSSQ